MKEAQRTPVNRIFGANCPKTPQKANEQKIKEILLTAAEKRMANRQIDCLLAQFRGKRIIDLLPLIRLRFPKVLAVALQRVERRKNDLGIEDAIFLANFKRSLDQKPE